MSKLLPYEAGMTLGMGFKSLDHSHCLLGGVTIEENSVVQTDQQVTFSILSVSTQSDLANALDIPACLAIDKGSLSMSGGGQLFKRQSVDIFYPTQ
jgi:uncharacterized protein YaiI (UPF0178 family)